MKAAIFIDGAFFLKRFPFVYSTYDQHDPAVVAKTLFAHSIRHITEPQTDLYRIFFYDCPPSVKKVHLPVSKRPLDLATTKTAEFRLRLYEELKKKRKTVLRLGKVHDEMPTWYPKKHIMRDILADKLKIEDLQDQDFELDIRQKQIDMKLGIDIATISYKQHVDTMVLIAGDSDFVPAAKLARREGVDFILDPLWHRIDPDLMEHIDGLKSVCPKPGAQRPYNPNYSNPQYNSDRPGPSSGYRPEPRPYTRGGDFENRREITRGGDFDDDDEHEYEGNRDFKDVEDFNDFDEEDEKS